MSQSSKETKTFTAGEALARNRLVKLGTTAGQVVYSDAADFNDCVGMVGEAIASGAHAAVALKHRGTEKLTASDAITAHDPIIAAADGKVAPDGGTSTENCIGFALEAATADGDIIECILFDAIEVRDLS